MIDKLTLSLGLPFNVNGIPIKPLTLKDIGLLGRSKYDDIKGVISLDVDDFDMISESLSEEDRERISALDIICMYSELSSDFKEKVLESFRVFINPCIDFVHGSFIVKDDKEVIVLDRDTYGEIKNVIFAQNKIIKQEKDGIKPGNEIARKFMEEQEKKRAMIEAKKREFDPDIEDYILALISDGMSLETIYNLTIYQLYAIIEQKQHIRESLFVNNAIYAGTIDSKGINKRLLDWVKKIK